MPIDHFSIIAVFYDRFGQFQVTSPLLELLSLSPNSLLLDAGGGTGRVAATLRGMVKEVFVVDLSGGMLRCAASKGLASVRAQVEYLPFTSGSIDRIVMMDTLHHVIDQSQTAHELWRVLAPGGRMLIVEPDIRKMLVKTLAIVEKLLLMRSHFLSGDEITALFKDPYGKVEVIYIESNVFLVAEKASQI